MVLKLLVIINPIWEKYLKNIGGEIVSWFPVFGHLLDGGSEVKSTVDEMPENKSQVEKE